MIFSQKMVDMFLVVSKFLVVHRVLYNSQQVLPFFTYCCCENKYVTHFLLPPIPLTPSWTNDLQGMYAQHFQIQAFCGSPYNLSVILL
ncbi:hypothetical protein ACJX0J_040106, partial [Zea mays]